MKRRKVQYHLVLLRPWKWNKCCFSSRPTTVFFSSFGTCQISIHQIVGPFGDLGHSHANVTAWAMASDYKILASQWYVRPTQPQQVKPDNLILLPLVTSYQEPEQLCYSIWPSIYCSLGPLTNPRRWNIWFHDSCGSLVAFSTPETFT